MPLFSLETHSGAEEGNLLNACSTVQIIQKNVN